jgi:hypothetical protein
MNFEARGIAAQRQGENSSAQAPKRDSPPVDLAIMSNGTRPGRERDLRAILNERT